MKELWHRNCGNSLEVWFSYLCSSHYSIHPRKMVRWALGLMGQPGGPRLISEEKIRGGGSCLRWVESLPPRRKDILNGAGCGILQMPLGPDSSPTWRRLRDWKKINCFRLSTYSDQIVVSKHPFSLKGTKASWRTGCFQVQSNNYIR